MGMKKSELIAALMATETYYITLPDGVQGVLLGIEREDTSGRSFLVKVLCKHPAGKSCVKTVFVWTID